MDPVRADLSEASPLLSSPATGIAPPVGAGETQPRRPSRTFIVVLLLLYLVFLDLGYELIMPAQTRVLETIICRQYYEQRDPSLIGSDGRDGVDEKWCKVKEVQGDLAMLKGWQLTLDCLGSKSGSPLSLCFGGHQIRLHVRMLMALPTVLVFALPWASVADRHGRKGVITLLTVALFLKYAYMQLICALGGVVPLRWTWLSAIHTAGGGSVAGATALVYTIISDVVPVSGKWVLLSNKPDSIPYDADMWA